MGGSKLEWFFNLVDKISGPATKARGAVDKLNASLFRSKRALSDVDKASGKYLDAAGKVREANGRFAGGSGSGSDSGGGLLANLSRAAIVAGALLATARAIGSAFAGAAESAGRFVVEQAVFHQSALTSLRATLHNQAGGGQAAATSEFRRSLQLAALLPGDNNEFVASRRQLANMFQNSRERDNVFALQEDLAALNPEDSTQVRASLTRLLGEVKGKDRMGGNDWMQLNSAGLGRTEVFDALARMRGWHGEQRALRQRASGMFQSGQVHGDESIRAMIEAVQARTGSSIGGFAMQQGNSIGGLLSNLESAPATLMQTLMLDRGLANMPGMQALTGTLRELNELFSPATARGVRFMGVMERLTNGVMVSLFRTGNATSAVDMLLSGLEAAVPAIVAVTQGVRSFLVPAFTVFYDAMKPVLSTLAATNGANNGWFQQFLRDTGTLVGVTAAALVWLTGAAAVGVVMIGGFVGELARELTAMWDGLASFFTSAWDRITNAALTWPVDASTMGANIVRGFAQGIASVALLPVDAMGSVGRGVLDTVTGMFDMHSPSRVMARLGGFVSEGFAQGIGAGAPGAGSALGALVGGIGAPRTTASALGAAAGLGGGASFGDVSVMVQTAPGVTDPDAVGEAVARVLPGALAEALRQLAIERGARTE